MKLFAQHGYAEGNKIIEGLTAEFIDGVVFSPKDIKPDRLLERIQEVQDASSRAEVFFDPQIYAAMITNDPRAKIGNLEEYNIYFSPLTKNRLEIEKNVISVLRKTVTFETELGVSTILAPNILISRSFDSREATISNTFIRLAKDVTAKVNEDLPVYATLAVSRDTLTNPLELQEFLNDITSVDSPPDGLYLIVSARNSETRLDIFNSDVIAGWLLLNYTLKVNGFKVINGYSDILTPFLGAVGGDAGSTGWWSNLRTFSMERFLPTLTGGRQPIPRYLCNSLLNRIRFDEYQSWKEFVPEIRNGIETDNFYEDEPERSKEVLQSWEAIKTLCNSLVRRNVTSSLRLCEDAIENAVEYYSRIQSTGLRPDPKSNDEHLEPLNEGIRSFRRIAEL